MLICEMAAYYRSIGSSIKQRLEEIYAQYGRYLNKIDTVEFPGLSGMDKMAGIMAGLRENPPAEFGGLKVASVTDYAKPEETGLPKANVLSYVLEDGAKVMVRPSGTEPKIKAYYTTLGKDLAAAQAEKDTLSEAILLILSESFLCLFFRIRGITNYYDQQKSRHTPAFLLGLRISFQTSAHMG